MRLSSFLITSLLVCLLAPTTLYTQDSNSGNELYVSIYLYTPIPGNRSYRGCNTSIILVVYNGFEDSVNVSVKPDLEPMELMWSNYTRATLDPGSSTRFTWIIRVPRSLGFGNYTLGFNITYTLNSTVYSMYREVWIEVIPRNISLITADLYRNATGYYLVVSNPLIDPGQYIIENVSITIGTFNVTVEPRGVLISRLYANGSYTIPLAITFNGSDMGALLVNITTCDDVHGLVHFNYTFIVFNATAYLDLRVIDDYGRPLANALVTIGNETHYTNRDGLISLVLPIGIYNYSVVYHGRVVSGKLVLYTGHNRYTIVVDLSPPIIASIRQRGYGIIVTAYDPGSNCSGIQRIVFIQDGRAWSFTIRPTRNMTILLYPSLDTGEVIVRVLDSQGNAANATFYYSKPGRPNYLQELILVSSIVFILVIVVLLLSLRLNT